VPPADQVVTHDLPPLTLRAAFNPRSVNSEKRTVDVVWSTGARTLRRFDAALDIWERFFEELSLDPKHVRLDRFNNSAPFCDGHPLKFGDPSTETVRGVLVPGSAKVDGKQGIATVRFAKAEDDPKAETLFRKITDGICPHVSVGYRIHAAERLTATADEKVPVYRAIDWEPVELSAVSAGDDDGAVFRSVATNVLTPCQFITRGASALAIQDADRMRRLRFAHAR
jgi:hypothetical protein